MTNGTTTTKNDHPSDKPLRPKYYRYLVYLGLLLYTAGLFILAVAPRFDLAKGGIIFWYVSGFGILIGGLIVLWLQNRTFWPEVLGVSVIVFAIFIFTFDNTGQEDRKLVLQRVPVAAEKVSGGVGGLAPEQAVGIVVYAPNASSTPVQTFGKVVEFSDKTVILDINVTDVSSFQSAVSLEKAQIAISYLTAVPSATASPEEPHTDTPIPKAWPDPITNYLYLEIAADNSVGALNIGSQGRLLVIEKSLQIEGTPVAELSTEVVNECVLIIDFLDENSVRQGSYMSGKTKQVLVQLLENKVEPISRSLALSERTYLILDPDCDPTAFPTPTHTPSPIPNSTGTPKPTE